MKHRQTVYYHRIILPCVFSELNPVSLLALNCLPKFSAIYKNIYISVCVRAQRVRSRVTARSHTRTHTNTHTKLNTP